MERYKSVYSSKEFYAIPETIFDLYKESGHSDNSPDVIGGISSDTKHSWLALGPYLQVFYSKLAKVRSVWCFGAVAKEPNAKIVCIQELKTLHHESTLLLVGLQYGIHTGMVCVYNLSCAKVLRAIEIPQHVTSVHVVSSGNDSPFPGPLSALDGIIAVGTVGGAVYLIDLCKELVTEARKLANVLDIRNESRPCQLRVLSKVDIHDLEAHKTAAEQDGTHVAILLNDSEVSGGDFELKAPTGRSVILASKKEVDVSTLQYAPQLCSLFVGYNFGALQIWNFLSLDLEYTSPVYEENMPVSFIAIQEPIDDPRAFCYFWAVYSYTGQYHNAFPLAALYSVTYESKDYHEGYGNIYRGLMGCSVRFQANLRMVDTSQCSSAIGANCIKLQSYSKVNTANSELVLSTDDEYTLCMMVWNVHCEEHKFHTYLSLFDLNQWYKEQMPNLAYQQHYMNYMTHLCLTEENASRDYPILNAQIDPSSMNPYVGATRLEEHYRPSSLAFTLATLTEIEVSQQCYLGAQRGLFKEMEEAGPLALMHPLEFYASAKALGLAPMFQDMPPDPPPNVQCDILLSIALERKMLKWLCKCATSWGNGSHRSMGLSLELLLNWGWERTRTLKSNVDRCCACLFDYSGTKLDANLSVTITACRVQFGNLKDLFNFIVKHCDTFLVHPEITRQQLQWLQKNYAYFNVIGWMINMKILPESRQTFPVDEIAALYHQRRNYLKSLHQRSLNVNDDAYLFIDQLTNVESLRDEWRDSDNGNAAGLYPPSTMQTLLRAYFNDLLDIKMVHSLVAYAMLDLVMHCQGTQENQNISATLIKFPQIFDLSMSTTKVIQAFWQFDRGQLEPAISQLVGRVIHPHDLSVHQHRFIVNVLKLQGQYRLALKYMKARNPKGNKEDVKHLIQLHVRNKMLFEALSIERRHSDDALLEAFFFECLQADSLMQLVSFNFTKREELALLEFMDKWNYSRKEEFKTIYFVRRGRFLDFYMRHDKEATKKHAMPSIVKNTLDNILPEVTKKVINTCLDLKGLTYEDTKSLSAYVCSSKERAKFNNDFVKACVVNCKDSWRNSEQLTEEDFPFMRPPCKRDTPTLKNVIYTRGVAKIMPRLKERVVEDEEERAEPPSKRMRLDRSRDDDVMNMTTIDTYFHRSSVMNTPCSNVGLSTATPLSILKTTSFSHRGDSTTPEDLEDLRRSMTPKLSGRPALATPTVRFTGLRSNDSSTNSITMPARTTLSLSTTNTKESTTTDYFSAESSLETSKDNRKRKFSDDVLPSPEVVEEPPFNDVEPSILRSSIGNITANRFLDSMRKSFVEEALPPALNVPIIIGDSPILNQDQSYLHKSVFVFTGADNVDTSALTPKARESYQHIDGESKKISLGRQVLESNALKLISKEVRHESKTTITSTSIHVEVTNNGETQTETKTVRHQEETSDLWKEKEVTQDENDLSRGDRSVVIMETEHDEEHEVEGQGDSFSGDTSTEAVNPKAFLSKTVIDLTDSPNINMSIYQRPGFIDYFSPSYQSKESPAQIKKLPRISKLTSKCFLKPSENKMEKEKESRSVKPSVSDTSNKSPEVEAPNSANETLNEISYLQPLEPTLRTKVKMAPMKLKFNTSLSTPQSNVERSVAIDVTDEMIDNTNQPETPKADRSIVTVELVDTPDINQSIFERPSFINYFPDTADKADKLDLSVEDSDGVQIVDVSDEPAQPQDQTETNHEVVVEPEEEPDQEREVNIYYDLSNPASSSHHYIMDPVMNNYNQPQETDYQAGLVLAEEPSEDQVVETSEANIASEYDAESLPAEELFESMDTVESNENSLEEHNIAVVEVISITNTSSENDEESSGHSKSIGTEDSNSTDLADVAFMGDSDSVSSSSMSNTTKENLDENVNEVKTSSKSESDTIVTETSVEPVKEAEVAEPIIELTPYTPKLRTRRSSSTKSDAPAMTIQLRPRRSSVSSETRTDTPSVSSTAEGVEATVEAPVSKVGKAVLRTRSMSTDTPPTAPIGVARRNVRARSVDVVALNPIIEEFKPSPRRMSRRLSEMKELKESDTPNIESDLLQARRLTRSQKQMMNDRTIDRLKLLDKDDFQGTSDPEEVNLLQRSPPSSIASSSAAENARQVQSLEESHTTTPKRGRGRPRRTPTPAPTATASEDGSRSESGSRSVRAGSVDSGSRTPRRGVRKIMGAITEETEAETTAPVAKKGRRRSVASSGK